MHPAYLGSAYRLACVAGPAAAKLQEEKRNSTSALQVTGSYTAADGQSRGNGQVACSCGKSEACLVHQATPCLLIVPRAVLCSPITCQLSCEFCRLTFRDKRSCRKSSGDHLHFHKRLQLPVTVRISMYNADGSLKTVGKNRYKGGNSGGGFTTLGYAPQ